MASRVRVVFVVLLAIGASPAAFAAEGDLDTSFSGDGIASFTFAASDELSRGVAIQQDGRIVVVGKAMILSSDQATIARLTRSGSLDVTFSGDGLDAQNPGLGADQAWDVAVQTDGKIVVGGCSFVDAADKILLLRYNTNGSLDTSFDSDGILTTGPDGSCAQSVAIQTDGKIVIAGYSADRTALAVARFNSSGTNDTTFSGDGIDIQDLGLGPEEAFDVAIQTDGKIVVAGCSVTDTTENMVLLRYLTGGTLDSSFDGDGIVIDNVSVLDDCLHAVALQSDGKIVVAGTTSNSNSALTARYNSNGSPDTSFSGDGYDAQNIGLGSDVAWDLAMQTDGKIVVAGSTLFDAVNEHLVLRYNTNGTLDTTFGSPNGWVNDLILDIESGGYGVALQADEQIVVTGFATDMFGTFSAVVRYHGPNHIFADGFESGNTTRWSNTVP